MGKFNQEETVKAAVQYTMEAHGLTEHGSSVGGAWLTKTGEMLLALLRTEEFEKWGD